MMAVNVKRLSEAERAWLDANGAPINIDRAWAASDRQIGVSRRAQAMLAAAGESPLPDRRWYVLCVVSGQEFSVDDDLRGRSVETWLPIDAHRPKRRSGRGKLARCERGDVAFDGYLFVRVCPVARVMTSLKMTENVFDAIGGWERPFPVSDSDIKALQAFVAMTPRERKRLEIEARKGAIGFGEGDAVIVQDGLLTGLTLTVERIGRDTVWGFVSVSEGRDVPVTLPLANLLNRD